MKNKELVHLFVQPDDNYFVWQVEALLENMIKLQYSHEIHCLMYTPRKEWNVNFLELEQKYKDHKNIKFFWFKDDSTVARDSVIYNYIPLLRPYCLKKHFENHPSLKDKTILYTDCDILFTNKLDFSQYQNDDICYLSDTSGYLNLAYLDGKKRDCLEERKEQLERIDVIDDIARMVGISREIISLNDLGTGGAQYIIKNIDSDFWSNVYESCKKIRSHFMMMNKIYFKNEDTGWQSWCADMWAVLWNLWKRELKTQCPKELDFSWATDNSERLKTLSIYHNAGASSTVMNLAGENVRVFYKGKYASNQSSPHKELDYLKSVDNRYANSFYATHLLSITNPIF